MAVDEIRQLKIAMQAVDETANLLHFIDRWYLVRGSVHFGYQIEDRLREDEAVVGRKGRRDLVQSPENPGGRLPTSSIGPRSRMSVF